MPTALPYRSYRAQVTRLVRLSPSFLRVTFGSDDLKHFGMAGLDQRVKLVFPLPGTGFGNFGLLDDPPLALSQWYGRWRLLDDQERNIIRTYTVRSARPEAREIDIDFVLHGDTGPASAWASTAQLGDELVVVGPDGRSDESSGFEWRPGAAQRLLLGGDETAMPAIAAIMESLPENVSGKAFIEVPREDDELTVNTRSKVDVAWLPRGDAAPGSRLDHAIRTWATENLGATASDAPIEIDPDTEMLWEVPYESDSDFYAWLAGEAKMITTLRRYLVRDIGLHRGQVAFMGYWRAGRAES